MTAERDIFQKLSKEHPADFADLMEKHANKPADSNADVSISAQPVEVEPLAVEASSLDSDESMVRAFISTSPRTPRHYERALSLANKYAPHLKPNVEAHFKGVFKPKRETIILPKMEVYHPESVTALNGILHIFAQKGPNWSVERKISDARKLLKYAHVDDLEALTATVDNLFSSVVPIGSEAAPAPVSVLRRSIGHAKLDPLAARAAFLAGDSDIYRLHTLIIQFSTDKNGGTNHVNIDDFEQYLQAIGLYTRASFSRWMLKGEAAGYWTRHAKDRRIYYVSREKVGSLVLEKLSDEQLEDFNSNQVPGSNRLIWVDCSGDIQEFRGNVIGAWFEQRSEEGVKISNARLAQMWGVTARTIQNRRARIGLTGTANYAEGDASIAPEHAVKGENGKMKWQMVNSYVAPKETRRHSHRGQQKKVRKAALITIKNRGYSPAVECAGGEAKQRYFDGKTALEAEKLAHKAIRNHRADEIIFTYQDAKRFSKRSQHERYSSREAYTA